MIGIVAADGDEEQVARDLLALARSVYDVQATSDKGVFMVPEYLAQSYTALMAVRAEPQEMPAASKRGRTRKEN